MKLKVSARNLALFGATGSIGTQALDVVLRLGGIRLEAATAGRDWLTLSHIAKRFKPRWLGIADETHYAALREAVVGSNVTVLAGREAAGEIAANAECEIALNSLVGVAGLVPSYNILSRGINLALANKESLVLAGDLLKNIAGRTGAMILPVDSEHSAIFQCLMGEDKSSVMRLILTASGGPFRDWSPERVALATPEEALKHPTWKMGPKITVDSATLMNKGLEVIEACHLFDLPLEQVEVRIHPVSIVHSLVQFSDGSFKAHLGKPDMRMPIAFALAWPGRPSVNFQSDDPVEWPPLEFKPVPAGRYPCLELARRAFKLGGTATAVLNGADEAAVGAFLDRRIIFGDIPRLIETALTNISHKPAMDLNEIINADRSARSLVNSMVNGEIGRMGEQRKRSGD